MSAEGLYYADFTAVVEHRLQLRATSAEHAWERAQQIALGFDDDHEVSAPRLLAVLEREAGRMEDDQTVWEIGLPHPLEAASLRHLEELRSQLDRVIERRKADDDKQAQTGDPA